jgi:predicted SAM-dependent methyltransferase
VSNYPNIARVLCALGIIDRSQYDFITFAQHNQILWADATKNIPLPDQSVEILYSSHMIEHLDRADVKKFLLEAYRVLVVDGVIRIAAPDIQKKVEQYCNDGDADKLIESTHLTRSRNRSLLTKLKYLVVGDRHHQWMYDGTSLVKLLSSVGFRNCKVMKAGTTTISNPNALNLREREDESVYVEGAR